MAYASTYSLSYRYHYNWPANAEDWYALSPPLSSELSNIAGNRLWNEPDKWNVCCLIRCGGITLTQCKAIIVQFVREFFGMITPPLPNTHNWGKLTHARSYVFAAQIGSVYDFYNDACALNRSLRQQVNMACVIAEECSVAQRREMAMSCGTKPNFCELGKWPWWPSDSVVRI